MVTFSDGCDRPRHLLRKCLRGPPPQPSASQAQPPRSTHALTAAYSGDANFFASTAAAISITTVTPGIAVSVSPGTLTITRGSSSSAVISVTSVGNYSGTITPTCAGLPSLATCTFSPTSIIFSGTNGTQTTTVTITTTAPVTSASLQWLAAVVLAGFIALRRKQLTGRSCHLLVLALMACGLGAVTGCGSSASTTTTTTTTTSGGTPLGNSTLTLTLSAAGSNPSSPTVQTTANLAITVQ